MDDPPINLVRHIRGHTADHIRPTVENGEIFSGLKQEAKGWYDATGSTLKTDAVADFTLANSEYLSKSNGGAAGLCGTGNFTISAWVKLDDLAEYHEIAGCFNTVGHQRGYLLRTNKTTGAVYFVVYPNGTGSGGAATTAGALSAGTLYHIVARYDGVDVRVFINGASAGSTAYTGAVHASTSEFGIGYRGNATYYMNGEIGLVGYWSRGLLDAEVTALYNAGTGRPYADLTTAEKVDMVSFWHLNEPSGTRYDAHGSNDLTDNNTVGVATGPVEYLATEHAKITRSTGTPGLLTDAVADFTAANSEYFTSPIGTGPDTNFSISTWVKFDVVTGSPGIASTYRATVGLRGPGVVLTASSEIRFFGFYQNGGTLESADCIGPVATTGTWYHVVATFDGSEIILYVNNTKYATTWSSAGQDRSDEDFWYIGSSRFIGYSDAKQQMFGSWSRAISDAEVSAIYNSGTPRPYADLTTAEKTGLVAFWHLNEPSGTRYDAHGSNDLTDNNTVGVATGPVEYLATEGAAITKWENQAGNASPFADLTKTAATLSPILSSGIPDWYNAAHALKSATGSMTQTHTIIALVNLNSAGVADTIVDGYGATNRGLIDNSAGGLAYLFASTPLWGPAVASGRRLYIGEFNGASSSLKITGYPDSTGNAGTGNMSGASVGAANSTANPFNGTVEYVILIDRALTSQEITTLQTL